MLAPGGNRPGGDYHDAVSGRVQLRALAHQFYDMGAVEPARSAGKYAGAQFHNQCLAAFHNVLPL